MNTVFRNSDGTCVHIGEWDEQKEALAGGKSFIRNPMPSGLIKSSEKVVKGWDGGSYVHDDPRQHASK